MLYMALDEQKMSYLQGTLQIIIDPANAEEVRQKLEELGVSVTVKEV